MTPVLAELSQVTTTAVHVLTPLWSFVDGFLILIVLFGLLFAFARVMDYGPFIALIAALYIGFALYVAFPYASYLPTAPAMTALGARLALYGVFTIMSYIILRKVAASDFINMSLVGSLIVSLLTAGFLMALAYQSFPVRDIYQFTPSLDQLFAAKEWFFAWFIAPLIGIAFLTR